MNIALVEPLWGGHRPMYLQQFVKVIEDLGQHAIVFCPEPIQMAALLASDCACGEPPLKKIVEYKWPAEPRCYTRWADRLTAIHRLKHLRGLLSLYEQQMRMHFDLVFFSCVDFFAGHYLTRMDWNHHFDMPFFGIYFDYQKHYLSHRHQECWRKFVFDPSESFHAQKCLGVGVLDDALITPLSIRLKNKTIMEWPDITDTTYLGSTALTAKILEKAKGRKVIGLLGCLSPGKAIFNLVDAFSCLPRQDYFLLMAGLLCTEWFTPMEMNRLNGFLGNQPENCYIHLNSVPDGAEFNALVKICDLMWLANHNFPFSSNRLTKTALLQVPVLVTTGGLLDRKVKQYCLGQSLHLDERDKIASILQDIQNYEIKYSLAFQIGCKNYLSLHDSVQLRKQMSKVICELASFEKKMT